MNSKQKNFISCVVYLHNEGERLLSFLEEINRLLEENFEKYEIICVDDASYDDSATLLQKYMDACEKSRPISLVHMSYYQGKEASMNAGRDLAVGDYVFEFDDAFMDYEPGLIMEVYQRALEGNDIVAAAPKIIFPYPPVCFIGFIIGGINLPINYSTKDFEWYPDVRSTGLDR